MFLRLKKIRPFLQSIQTRSLSKMDTIDGASLLVKSLKDQGVKYMFGVVGIPVIEVAMMAQQQGIKFIGMRNEQSASYAASAIGYLTQQPAVCLVVSGPGFVHALAGMSNANENAWPLIVVGGSSDSHHESHGAFQEFPQVSVAKHFAKYTARPSSLSQIPFFVEKAVRSSIYGRPGSVYLDLPAEMITGSVDINEIKYLPKCENSPRPYTSQEKIKEVVDALECSKKPLFIIGKGAAYAKAEDELTKLMNKLEFPFIPTPMGKGVIDDDSENCYIAARSTALKEADLIVLVGARLNWMLHFGASPRFDKNTKFIQVDINAEELGNNATNTIKIQADIRSFCEQLNDYLSKKQFNWNENISNWRSQLKSKSDKNKSVIEEMMNSNKIPMNYYSAYANIKKILPQDCIIVSEGANTMDTSRSVLMHRLPRHRLDAGSFGTMGVGSGFAIAAAIHSRDTCPHKRVVCIQGDSAFGFGGMELETAFRYMLPIVFIVFNNNGIYSGLDKETFGEIQQGESDPCLTIPPTCLYPNIRYDRLSQAFDNFKGFNVETQEELQSSLREALSIKDRPSIINVKIDPTADRKAQEFPWLTKSKI